MYVFDIIIFIFCIIPAALSLRSIFISGIKPFSIMQIVFFILFVVPLIVDKIFIPPSYYDFPGFISSIQSQRVSIIYNFFVLFMSWFFWMFRGDKSLNIDEIFKVKKFFILAMALLVVSPLFLFIFSPDKTYYYIYGGAGIRDYSLIAGEFHSYLNMFTFLSVIFSALFLNTISNKNIILKIFLVLLIFTDFWLNGKRTIVLIFIFFFCLFYLVRNFNLKALILAIMFSFVFLIYSNWYQTNIRDYDSVNNSSQVYENFRIDFFRDQRLKMAIFAEINDNMKILNYRGESLVFLSTIYIPRSMWENKPLPYAQNFTSAIYSTESQLWGWGMTTSIFDEFVANLGMGGLLLIFPFLYFYNNFVLRLPDEKLKFLFLFLMLILFAVEITAFILFYLLAFLWYLKVRIKFRFS